LTAISLVAYRYLCARAQVRIKDQVRSEFREAEFPLDFLRLVDPSYSRMIERDTRGND